MSVRVELRKSLTLRIRDAVLRKRGVGFRDSIAVEVDQSNAAGRVCDCDDARPVLSLPGRGRAVVVRGGNRCAVHEPQEVLHVQRDGLVESHISRDRGVCFVQRQLDGVRVAGSRGKHGGHRIRAGRSHCVFSRSDAERVEDGLRAIIGRERRSCPRIEQQRRLTRPIRITLHAPARHLHVG